MKESVYRSYDALPLFLNSNTVSKVLEIMFPLWKSKLPKSQ